jgi:WD40 repeat protein
MAGLLVSVSGVPAQAPAAEKVLLRLEPGGPTSFVSAVAFSPDGRRLYAAGFDKVVTAWSLGPGDTFGPGEVVARVPIGPGLAGALNALAVSPDGKWLAVGGEGVFRGAADERTAGVVFPTVGAKTDEMRRDEGVIYVVNLATHAVRTLRGHAGHIRALAFAPAYEGKPLLLVSAADERNAANAYEGHLRLWDADRGETLAEQGGASKSSSSRPGLAVWHTGKGVKQVSVAVAWNDETLRVWDGERLREIKDGKYNNSVVALPESGTFLTGSLQAITGRLRAWRATGGEAPQVERRPSAAFEPPDRQAGPFSIPRALTLFPGTRGGPPDRAAVILRQLSLPGREETDVLAVVDLGSGTVEARVPLGKPAGVLRSLAASPDGRHLAVAGGSEPQVAVYKVGGLGRDRPNPQILRSAGDTLRSVAFVRRGNEHGLLLNESAPNVGAAPRAPAEGDLLFDFSLRKLTGDTQEWRLDAPDLAGWQVRSEAGKDRPALLVGRRDEQEKRIVLGAKEEVTAYALMPPSGAGAVPLLAVGFLDEYRQPGLALFNAVTGQQVRQLTAHVGPVRCLTFSADGKLLASAAEDQTVCVWSLTNLDKILGKKGRLPGLAVRAADGKLVVAAPDDEGRLKIGEIVEGLVDGDRLNATASPRAFYEAVFVVPPGKTVTVRAHEAGGPARDVVMRVGQGIDERKPLLSLFVTAGGKPEERRWIGWNPSGPYEVSAPAAEQYLGWHFNTGKPDAPTSFAKADQYRKEHSKPGILKLLVQRASLSAALEDWQKQEEARLPHEPRIGLWIDEVGPTPPRIAGRALVRQRDLTLKLTIDNDFPAERIGSVRWQLDDGPLHDFGPEIGGQRSASLSLPAGQRGPHQVKVVLGTREPDPREFLQRLDLHYQPLPPEVQLDPAWVRKQFGDARPDRLVVRDRATLPVEANARPGSPGEKVRAKVRRGSDAFEDVPDPEHIRKEIALQPGDNVIEVTAVNDGALRGHEELETARTNLVIYYVRPEAPPSVLLKTVTAGAASITVVPGQPVVVSVPEVRVQGEISAEANLQEVRRDDRDLADFRPGSGKRAAIDEAMTLQPGRQVVRFTARTANSPSARSELTLEYRPPLPRLVLTAPAEGEAVFADMVEVRGRLTLPQGKPQPFKAAVLVDRREQEAPTLAEENRTLSARVRLHPGANQIELRLSNEWGETATTERQVTFQRPPRIVAMEEPALGPTPFVDLVARVESPADLPPLRVRANGGEWPADAVRIEKVGGQDGLWRVVASKVPLDEGDNTLRLVVANKDGPCLAPATRPVRWTPPAPPAKATVEILDPRVNENVATADYHVSFAVHSDSPLQRVQLLRGGEALVTADVAGKKEIKQTALVKLAPGLNDLRVEAVNDGGVQDASVTLTCVYRPVRVVIDRLESRTTPGQFFNPLADPDEKGRTVFPLVPEGKARLHGRVVWTSDQDRLLGGPSQVRVFANGFQQVPVTLAAAARGAKERTFQADVLLSRPRNNRIDIDLPALSLDADHARQCVVQVCSRPFQGQRLHLLIVGIGQEDGKKLVDGALKALQARPVSDKPGRYTAPPAFQEVLVYGPLVQDVGPGDVFHKLNEMRKRIETSDVRDPSAQFNDVVLLYYQGGERITREGHFFVTDETQYDSNLQRSAVSCDRVARFFASTEGAQLLMLDTVRAEGPRGVAEDRVDRWPPDVHAGVLRYAWLSGGRVPADARLLTALEENWPRADNLGVLEGELEGTYRRIAEKYPKKVNFDRHVPAGLADLVIGRRALE